MQEWIVEEEEEEEEERENDKETIFTSTRDIHRRARVPTTIKTFFHRFFWGEIWGRTKWGLYFIPARARFFCTFSFRSNLYFFPHYLPKWASSYVGHDSSECVQRNFLSLSPFSSDSNFHRAIIFSPPPSPSSLLFKPPPPAPPPPSPFPDGHVDRHFLLLLRRCISR